MPDYPENQQEVANDPARSGNYAELNTDQRFATLTPRVTSVATNDALQDTIVLNEGQEYLRNRIIEHSFGETADPMIQAMYGQLSTANLQEAFAEEIQAASAPDDMLNVVSKYQRQIKSGEMSASTYALMYFLNNAEPDDWSTDAYDNFYARLSPFDIGEMARGFTQEGQAAMRSLLDETYSVVTPDEVYEQIPQAMWMFVTLFSESGFLQSLENAGLEEFPGSQQSNFLTPGGIMENIRDWLQKDATEQEIINFLTILRSAVVENEKDWFTGTVNSNYNIKFALDYLIGDVDSFLENRNTSEEMGLYTWSTSVANILDYTVIGGIVSRILTRATGRGITGNMARLFAAGTPGGVGRIADTVGNTSAARALREALESRFGVTLGDTVETQAARGLPKPDVDDIQPPALSGTSRTLRQIQEEAETEAARILNPSIQAARLAVPVTAKIDRVAKELDEVARVAEGAHINPQLTRMNTLDNDTGVRLGVVLGATENTGFWRMSDALEQALKIDPSLTRIKILAKNTAGKLEEVPLSRVTPATTETLGAAESAGRGIFVRPRELFVEYSDDIIFHSTDQFVFGAQPFLRHTAINVRRMLAPLGWLVNAEWAGKAIRAFQLEEATKAAINKSMGAFYKLSQREQKKIYGVLQWVETYGRRKRRKPTLKELFYHFDDLTEKEIKGLMAHMSTMDVIHDALDMRLFRDRRARGFVTAHHDDGMDLHGAPIRRELLAAQEEFKNAPVTVYDPVSMEARILDDAQLDELYHNGGSIIKIDETVEAAMEVEGKSLPSRHKFAVIDPREGYTFRELSPRQLRYTPGYTFRFYDDTHYIVKQYKSIVKDGKIVQASRNMSQAESAILRKVMSTAGTRVEAEKLRERLNARLTKRDTNYTYEIVPISNLGGKERTAALLDQLQQEGRTLWDKRRHKPIPNLHGNQAHLYDPIKSLQDGINLVSRSLAQEDWLGGMRNAFLKSYGKVINSDIRTAIKRGDSRAALQGLRDMKGRVAPELEATLREATRMWRWLRIVEGVNSDAFAGMRMAAHELAVGFNRYVLGDKQKFGALAGVAKGIEKAPLTWRPLNLVKSAAFQTYLALFPGRQALMQSAQVGFIAPLDPLYVYSGMIFSDAMALRLGVAKRWNRPIKESMSDIAKASGNDAKDFESLINAFFESGILETVNASSYRGGASAANRVGHFDSMTGFAGDITQATAQFGLDGLRLMQRIGFDFGEKNNLTFSYLIAARQHAKSTAKTYRKFSVEDWDEVAVRAQNLGIGMIRPLDYGMQHNIFGLATQFLGFGFKAFASMMGLNPAIKADVANMSRLWIGTMSMYGGNMFGAREMVQEMLNESDITQNLPDTAKDIIAGGLVDYTFNNVAEYIVEEILGGEYGDLAIGETLAPGQNMVRLHENLVEGVFESSLLSIATGPSYTMGSRVFQAASFARFVLNADVEYLTPADKFKMIAESIMAGTLPQYSNAFMARVAWKMDQWYTQAGEPSGLRPTWNELIARGVFGIRSRDEITSWTLRGTKESPVKEYNEDIVRTYRQHMSRLLRLHLNNEPSMEDIRMQGQMLFSLFEDMDDDERYEVQDALLAAFTEYDEENGPVQMLSRFIREGHTSRHVIALTQDLVDSGAIDPVQGASITNSLTTIYDQKRTTPMFDTDNPDIRGLYLMPPAE